MSMALAMALHGRMSTQGLKQRDLCARTQMPQSAVSRLLGGGVKTPRLGTLLAVCRAVETDPTTLLELAGMWPRGAGPADAQDHALLTARLRIEALPPDHKCWALAVVQALLSGAPSTRQEHGGGSVSLAPSRDA